MNKLLTKILAIGVIACTSASLLAQDRPGRGGGGGGMRQGGMMGMRGGGFANNPALLVQRADVQRDINLSADQKTKLEAMNAEMREKMQAQMEEMRAGGSFDRDKMQAAMQAMQEESKKKLAAILTPEQMKRVGEIGVQMRGTRAVMDPEIQKTLGLSEDQKAKIKELQEKQQAANRTVMEKVQSGELTREQSRETMDKNNKIMDAELAKVLTAAQNGKLKEMGGKPFKADPEQERGGGRIG